MNVSLNWLSDMLGRELDPRDVAERLAMLGAPVEAEEELSRDLGDVVVGLVERVEQHPNADRLTVCHVRDGSEVREVVCGATNVREGVKYPYAPAGAVLPGGLKLSARKIRGVVSQGMLCSARELGLGTDQEGIMELRTVAEPGTPLLEAMPIADTRLDIEVTPNRPDLLGHRGVARELGAVYGVPVKLPPIPGAPPETTAPNRVECTGTVDSVEVTVDDAQGCPRYIAAVVRGVKVGSSPTWLEARLLTVGVRLINNVVDATNYILQELNQPMHAFDLARIRGGRVVVRCAEPGERLRTLDGEMRDLEPDMTMICDGEGPMAIGGVMGGSESEVSSDTTDILLECAYFDPARIRRTRQILGMNTEASYRFERGIDIDAMEEALRRAVQLIRAVAGGEEHEGAVDVYSKPARSRSVFLRPQRVEHLLGTEVRVVEIERLLVSLGFAVAPKDDRLHVQVPGWRPDVTREVDLIEEVARLRGYDSFPLELRPFRPSMVPDDPGEALKAVLRRVMTALGLHEARSFPLTGVASDDSVRLSNPLSAEEAYLRTDLLPGLVASVRRNWDVRQRDVRLFEIGTVFHAREDGGRPLETLRVAAVITGARTPPHWSTSGKSPDVDLWDVKVLFETLAAAAGPVGTVEPSDDGWVFVDADGGRRGRAGPLGGDPPAWGAPLYGLEIDAVPHERSAVQYEELPTTPAMERDVALVLPGDVTAADVEGEIRSAAGALLETLYIFDEYRGEAVQGRSVAWRLVFRVPGRTLRDADADAVVDRVLVALKERFDVERR